MSKKQPTNPIEEEKLAEQESEAMEHHKGEPSAEINMDENAEEGLIAEEAADADQSVPAEVAAIHEVKEKKTTKKPASKKEDNKPKNTRSAKYQKAHTQLEPGKLYSVADAIELVKKMSYAKFDSGIELHIRLSQKKSKGSTESSRGLFHLPHGSGKNQQIIVLDEKKIEEIAKTKKIDFDVALSSPELMPKVAKIAKILGPKGKMPDPKAGTVTTDPKKTIEEINSGRAEYRIDASNNIHQLVGRVSWDSVKVADNVGAALGGFPKSRVVAAYLAASMSPSVALDLASIK